MINQEKIYITDKRFFASNRNSAQNDPWDIIVVIAVMSIILIGFLLATSVLVLPTAKAQSNMQNIPGETVPLPLPADADPTQFLPQ